jgi:hypothetical protein
MKRLNSILKHFNVLNALLAAILAAIAALGAVPFLDAGTGVAMPKGTEAPVSAEAKAPDAPAPAAMEYAAIVEQSLFSPERKPPVEKGQELPKPEIVLYGTLVAGDFSVAYLEDKKAPVTSEGRGRRQTALKLGERIGGFTLKTVSDDRIELERAGEIMMVRLDQPDPLKRNPSAAELTAAPGADGARPAQRPARPSAVPVRPQPPRR